MNKKRKPIRYLNTYCEGEYNYEIYLEWCKDNSTEPHPEGSEKYWRWIGDMIQNDIEDFFENLKYSPEPQHPCVISGSLGLWHGRPDIEPVMMPDLASAIRTCMDGADAVEVNLENGMVEVKAFHHDGTNLFEIRPLTDRGYNLMNDGEDINVNSHWHTGRYPKYLY